MLSCRPFPLDASSHRPNGRHGIAWDDMGIARAFTCRRFQSLLQASRAADFLVRSCRKAARRPVSRVLSALAVRDDHSSGTRLAARLTRPTRTAERECSCAVAAQPSLFGLAPGGVYPAAPVARGAVRSCRTVSPLPAGCLAALARAVCFLWHFPWGRPRRPLAGTVFPWSPDFPLPLARQRPSSRLAAAQIGRRRVGVKASDGGGVTALAGRCRATWPLRGSLPAPRADTVGPERRAEQALGFTRHFLWRSMAVLDPDTRSKGSGDA